MKIERCDMCGRAAVLRDVGPTARWCADCLQRYPSNRIAERQLEPEVVSAAGEPPAPVAGYGPGSRWKDEELSPPPHGAPRQQDTPELIAAEMAASWREMGADIDRLERERDAARAEVEALKCELRGDEAHQELLVVCEERDKARRARDYHKEELANIREAFTSRCWDAGDLAGERLLGAVISTLQSQSVLRETIRALQARIEEREEQPCAQCGRYVSTDGHAEGCVCEVRGAGKGAKS